MEEKELKIFQMFFIIGIVINYFTKGLKVDEI